MAIKEFGIFVDIVNPIKNEVFTVSTNDLNSVKVNVEVTKKKIPFDLTGATARIAIQKPDGNTVLQDGLITDPDFGLFEITLDSQAYIVPGNHEAEIMIFDADDVVLVTSGFRYIAKKGIVDNETVESTNEWQSINAALVDGEAAKAVVENTGYVEPYNITTTYEKNNIVSYNGSSYMAKRTTKGNAPTDLPSDLNWGIVSRKGADGTGTVHVKKDTFIALEGQAVFTLTGTYDQFQNRTEVIVGYVPQSTPSNYQESSPNTITLSEGVAGGTIVEVKYFSEAVPLQGDIETELSNQAEQIGLVQTELGTTAKKTEIVDMATKSYVAQEIIKVNTGGTVDISSKADVTYVDQVVDEKGLLTFNTIAELEAAYPNGLYRPVWIESEKTWYSWIPDVYESYLAPTAGSKSNTAYWKGTAMNVKQEIRITEIGAVGDPQQWSIWEVVSGKLTNIVASGVFDPINIINNASYYNLLPITPTKLLSGKTYILLVKYSDQGSYYTTGEEKGVNDDFIDIINGTYNFATLPATGAGLSTVPASNFVYKHYLKYEA